jgi:hypothetical protein
VLLCPPQIPLGLTQAQTQPSAVRGTWLTTWAMAWPSLYLSFILIFPHIKIYPNIFLIFIFTRLLWMNISPLVRTVPMSVMCVINHLLFKLHWRVINADTLEKVHISVVCAESHSVGSLIWKGISTFILGSGCILVMCVTNHFIRSMISSYISAFTLASVHILVMCAVNLSVGKCI